jgi:dTDP-4-amino-4,6-dideoxygalactose transaminase
LIRMNAFADEPASLHEEMLRAAGGVIASGRYVLDREVEAFEREWAAYCGIGHCVGVGNGLDAIEIGLRALEIGVGDEVVTTSMTAFATVLGIIRVGATPVFADIDPDTALIDPASVQRCLSPRTRAIIPVHLYGQACPMDRLAELADAAGAFVLEDCAQAHGARHNGTPVGSTSELAAWSFYPTKNLGAIGDAGAVTTRSPGLAERMAALRNYGQVERGRHEWIGQNSRLDELQAALLRVRLSELPAWNSRRQQIARAYLEGIDGSGDVKPLQRSAQREDDVYHLFVVRCRERDALREHLLAHGVESGIHYPVPAHLQPPCHGMRHDPLGLGNTEHHARDCLSLPCHPQLSDSDVEQVIDSVRSFSPGQA